MAYRLPKKTKKKLGDKLYPFGVQVVFPNIETGEATTVTFQGAFDRRKLRHMIRKVLVAKVTTDQIDYIIDNFSTKLRPVSMAEVIKAAQEVSK